MNASFSRNEPILPDPNDIATALKSSKDIAAILQKKDGDVVISVKSGDENIPITLPYPAIKLLYKILTEMAQGNAVKLIPIHASLTTQEAADLLNVSRPFLIKLLENGSIIYEKVGSHRRIKADELLKYKANSEKKRQAALDELTRQAQDLDMGY